MTASEWVWVTIGAVGQTLYGARMIVQWWVSEKQGKSVVPASFWHLSLIASVLMMAYALWRRDPVFIGGQVIGLAIYTRNLSLLSRKTVADSSTADLKRPRAESCDCPCTCGASTRKAA